MSDIKRYNRIMISATGSGKGKTTFTMGLLAALKERGLNVCAFKSGPDYIDPMYHRTVIGVPSKNLDPFFCDEDRLLASFLDKAVEGENAINVIEGAMGLFDGIGVSPKASSYELAVRLRCPIILVVDCSGAGYSIIPVIKGFLAEDREHLIKGVMLNKISAMYCKKLTPIIEKECRVDVIGYVPNDKELSLDSRHLGLKAPGENNAAEKLKLCQKLVEECVDFDKLSKVMADEAPLMVNKKLSDYVTAVADKGSIKIAVAMDEAFSFYYEDNLKALEWAGAKIEYFSPLKDAHLPDGCCGVLLGGGYPELHEDELVANTSLIEELKEKAKAGMPMLAECGGFMYLNYIGLLEGEVFSVGKSVRFGYIYLSGDGYSLKGHEFHHYDVTNPGDEWDVNPAGGRAAYKAMIKKDNVLAGFPHLYYLSDPCFAEDFVKRGVEYKNEH